MSEVNLDEVIIIAASDVEVLPPTAKEPVRFREVFPDHGDDVVHETVMQAIGDTSRAINQVRSAKRGMGKWLMLMSEGTEEEAVTFFSKPAGTATRVGISTTNKRMIAVWNVDGTDPTEEPLFT